MAQIQPIIIRKKRASHGGHHGGAWKVAYADFVTAMMALFIVLWLLSSSDNDKKAIAGYFRDPLGKTAGVGTGVNGSGEGLVLNDMSKLKEKIEEAFKKVPEFQQLQDKILVTVTGEGLRIDFLESKDGLFFESGSSVPTAAGNHLLGGLAKEIGTISSPLLVEGHTDAQPFKGRTGYGNWELSADRANAARRILQEAGVGAKQISQVRGYADQKSLHPDKPDSPSNRRISIVVLYTNGDKTAAAPASAHGAAAPAPAHGAAPAPAKH
ncbi:MAG: OmpA family protein [Bryobacteraceae bacterium]|nr:OmpA family protein [Bryobacteraceae bacterium]